MWARIPIAAAVALTAGLVAAARATAPSAPSAPVSANAPVAAAVEEGASGPSPQSVPNSGAVSSVPTPGSSLEENLMTYAYAAADVADLEEGINSLAAAAESLTSGAESWSLGRIRQAAETLRDRSAALERLVREARGRMEPRAPRDPSLVAVWRDALAAYDLAGRHADAAGQLAEFALTFDAEAAAGAGEAIEGLARAETSIASACADLRSLLGAWAEAHPGQADAAVGRYPR
ncbi:MAG: hypothetical protein WD770_02725 [Actinomycetota bacterium]